MAGGKAGPLGSAAKRDRGDLDPREAGMAARSGGAQAEVFGGGAPVGGVVAEVVAGAGPFVPDEIGVGWREAAVGRFRGVVELGVREFGIVMAGNVGAEGGDAGDGLIEVGRDEL